MTELHGEQYDLLVEAVRKCFWYKRPFVSFLTRCGVPRNRAEQVHEASSKAIFFRELIEEYSVTEEGRTRLYSVARALIRLKHFTALEHDGQVEEAREAVRILRESFDDVDSSIPSVIQQQSEIVKAIPSAKHGQLRLEINERMTSLFAQLGTPEGGWGFEDLICDLAMSEDLEVRKPYRVGNEKQLDGSVAIEGKTYLIESKFRSDPSGAPAVRDFISKIQENANLTQGLFVSMSGFTSSAVAAASRAGSPVVLLEGDHVTNAVFGGCSFERMIILGKRHASETGKALLKWPEMKVRMMDHPAF